MCVGIKVPLFPSTLNPTNLFNQGTVPPPEQYAAESRVDCSVKGTVFKLFGFHHCLRLFGLCRSFG